MEHLSFDSVDFSAAPFLGVAIGAALRPLLVSLAGWLARFLGSWLMMGLFALVAEFIPRLLGLGQGLISWGFGVVASASFSAFQTALSMAGVELPSFSELLSGLPPGVVWMGSALRIHRVVFILTSILVVKLLRKAAEAALSAASKHSAASLMSGGK